ncbi:MAG: hypothetical protein MZV64_59100 [Ignavibacteriales bacterium]|nr:hypothetical protein [Ignavibacteriales bacterium]
MLTPAAGSRVPSLSLLPCVRGALPSPPAVPRLWRPGLEGRVPTMPGRSAHKHTPADCVGRADY